MFIKRKRKCSYRKSFCKIWFKPKSIIQRTCGNKECIDANRRKKRKIWGLIAKHRENLRETAEDWRKLNPQRKKEQNQKYYLQVIKLKREKLKMKKN